MKSFFQTRKLDKPPESAQKAYKIWIPPAQIPSEAPRTKLSRAPEYVEVRPTAAAAADKSSRRSVLAAPSSKPYKSQAATGPSAVSAAPTYVSSSKHAKHTSSASPTPGPSTPFQHATSTQTNPSEHSYPPIQYSSLPSNKVLRHTHTRTRTIPSTTQPDFWIPPPSESPPKVHHDRNGHSWSRTDPTPATQIWQSDPAKRPPELLVDQKLHRNRNDNDSIRQPDRERERAERKERDRMERDREREKRKAKEEKEKEKERERRREDSDADKAKARRADRERHKDESERRERRQLDKHSSRNDSERERRDVERKTERKTQVPNTRHPEKESKHGDDKERHTSSREARPRAPVPVLTRSYDEYESSDSMKPRVDATSHRRRHRTEEVIAVTKETKQYPNIIPPSALASSIYEAPIRPLSSPFLANVQAPSIDYQIVLVDNESPKSKKEKHRQHHSPVIPSHSQDSTIAPINASRVDHRAVINTPNNIERFAVPVQNSSTSSREATPRRDDNSSLEISHRHDRVPSSSRDPSKPGPSSSAIPTSTSQNGGLGLSISSPQTNAPRDSPVMTKYSPGKRSLQEKVNYEYGVVMPAEQAGPSQVSSSSGTQTGVKSSPPKRQPNEAANGNKASGSERKISSHSLHHENVVDIRSAPSNPDIPGRMSNVAAGNSIPRSSTAMTFRPDNSNRAVPIPRMPSFSSHAAASGSLQRPSTAAGFSSQTGPHGDTSALARAAFFDQQRDRLSGQSQFASRTPFPPSRMASATPLPIPTASYHQQPADRPRADSGASMARDAFSVNDRHQHISNNGFIPPSAITQQTSLGSQTQSHSKRENSSMPNGPSTSCQSVGNGWAMQSSSVNPIPLPPPRDTSTPKPYRHPILTELLTSPTNNNKYLSAAQKSTSAPWDYLVREQPQSAQEPLATYHLSTQPPSRHDDAHNPPTSYPSSQPLHSSIKRDNNQPESRPGPYSNAEHRDGSSNASMQAAPTSSYAPRVATALPPNDSSRQKTAADNNPLHTYQSVGQTPLHPTQRASIAAPIVDISRQRAIDSSWKVSPPHVQSANSAIHMYGGDNLPPSNITHHYTSSTTPYDSYATRTSSIPASAATVTSPSQAIDRPPIASSNASSQAQSQNNVSLPLNTHVATAPLTSSSVANRPIPHHTASSPEAALVRSTSHDSIMRTPSSLASVLKKTPSRSSVAGSIAMQESKKKGFLGIFRSRATSTPASIPSTAAAADSSLATTGPSEQKEDQATTRKSLPSRAQVPPPITVPPQPNVPTAISHSSAFTPFKYLSSKRHRTVSGASLEAVNGTANNTVVGSPTASMLSSNPAPPSVRDPVVATKEWREQGNAEAIHRRDGKHKIRRPGIVFELKEDPPEDKPKPRHIRKSKR